MATATVEISMGAEPYRTGGTSVTGHGLRNVTEPSAEMPTAPTLSEELSFREIGERLNISHELARLNYNSALRKLQTIGQLVETNDPDFITDEELAEIAAALKITAEDAHARYICEIAALSKLTDALHIDNVRSAPQHYPVALRKRLRRFEEVADDLPEELPGIPLPSEASQGEQQ